MDQVHVEAPALSARAASVEREFYSDFPLVLNYVARLIDDIDGAAAITCAAFRQVGDGLRGNRLFLVPRAAGRDVHQRERDQRDEHEHRNQPQNATKDVRGHGSAT